MAETKDAIYKVHNGNDFDTIHFETKASQVKTEAGGTMESHLAKSVTDAEGVHGWNIEKGVWTPIIRGLSVAGNNSYSKQEGRYTIENDEIEVYFDVTISQKDANMSGALEIEGLPVGISSMLKSNLTTYTHTDIQRPITISSSPSSSSRLRFLVYGGSSGVGLVQPAQFSNGVNFSGYARYKIS